jgi:hypothetical protein
MGGEMKGLLVITIVLLTAMSVLAYGHADMAGVVADTWRPGEPATLLLSGSALLGIAGALRRFTV